MLALFVVCGMGGAALEWLIDPLPVALGGNGAALGLRLMLVVGAVSQPAGQSDQRNHDGPAGNFTLQLGESSLGSGF